MGPTHQERPRFVNPSASTGATEAIPCYFDSYFDRPANQGTTIAAGNTLNSGENDGRLDAQSPTLRNSEYPIRATCLTTNR